MIGNSPSPRRFRLQHYTWGTAALWSVLILGLTLWYLADRAADNRGIALNYARAVHEKDVLYRRWSAAHGGVYVVINEHSRPNPYLTAQEREVVTPSGRVLTLVNPAYMTRQVHEMAARDGTSRAHMVSARPLNPVNAPDRWEAEALQALEQGEKEVSSLVEIVGQPHMRLIRPLYVEPHCLSCHGSQGYKVGDLRGGISVIVPVGSVWNQPGQVLPVVLGYGGLWGLGLVGIAWVGRKFQRHLRERERSEKALEQSEQRFRLMFEQGPLGIVTAAVDGRILAANQAFSRMLGRTPEELTGMTVQGITYPGDFGHESPVTKQMVRGEASVHSDDKRYRHKDGHWVWGRVTCTVVRDPQGRIAYVLALIEDIAERRRAEEALRQSEQRYRLLAQAVKDVIWTSTLDFRWTYCSPSVELLTGYTAEETKGLGLQELVTSQTAEVATRLLTQKLEAAATDPSVLTERVGLEAEFKCKNGETVWAEVVASFMLSRDGTPLGLVGVSRDISTRKAIQAQLVKAKEFAEEANRAKSEFLANMSHEIRTPLTAILGYADILAENVNRHEDAEAVHTIRRNGEHLLGIINGILDLSKIDAGRLTVDAVACSPHRLVAEVVSLMRVPAQAKAVSLKVEYLGPIPATIHVDPTRLRQVLINLVGNAIKFTEVGEVCLKVRLLDADPSCPKMEFQVVDTGIGMTEEQIARLFQPFSQVHASFNRRYGGTGLGLAISKRLATLLDGDLRVASRPMQGSTFTLTVGTGSLKGIELVEGHHEALLESGKESKPCPASSLRLPCRILLAEDGPDNQRLISFLLRKSGAEVSLAGNGQDAFEQALAAERQGQAFDVVLMDMQMPIVDGYEATRRLRAANYHRPIIALTAHAMSEDRQKCLDAGCSDYLSKPIQREGLLATVARHVERPCPTETAKA